MLKPQDLWISALEDISPFPPEVLANAVTIMVVPDTGVQLGVVDDIVDDIEVMIAIADTIMTIIPIAAEIPVEEAVLSLSTPQTPTTVTTATIFELSTSSRPTQPK